MLLWRLWRYLIGYLRIDVYGEHPERFLNLAASQGLDLWDIVRTGDRLQARIGLRDFLRIRPIARRSRCRPRIIGRHGLPFTTGRIKRRGLLVAGALLCALAIYLTTSVIWFIEVKGTEYLDPGVVKAAAAELGLRPGTFKYRIDRLAIENELPGKVVDISWAGVTLNGTRAVIEVVERAIKPPEPPQSGHIVARKKGFIHSVIVFSGRAAVKEGEMVKPGDPLIWGNQVKVIPPPEGSKGPGTEQIVKTMRARGTVRAIVWYTDFAQLPSVKETRTETGRRHDWAVMKMGATEILVRGSQDIPFATYEVKQDRLNVPQWRNLKLPVEIIRYQAREIRVVREEITEDRARELASRRLVQQVKVQLGSQDRIESVEARITQRGKDFYTVRVDLQTIEEIGELQPDVMRQPGSAPGR